MPNYKILLDVDGTLTPHNSEINKDFFLWLVSWIEGKEYYLASSDKYETVYSQLGEELTKSARAIFCCDGNDVYIQGKRIVHHSFSLPNEVKEHLLNLVDASKYPEQYGHYLESKDGVYTFFVCGKNATAEQRQKYFVWDKEHKERALFVTKFNNIFLDYYATVSGQTEIHITEAGRDKSQIASMVEHPVIFIGDGMIDYGDDILLGAEVLKNNGKIVPVTDWKDAWHKVKILEI